MSDILRQELNDDPLSFGYADDLPDSPGIVAEKLNALTRSMLQSRFVTARTIASELSLTDAGAVLGGLKTLAETNALVGAMWAFLLKDSGIDIGNANTQTMIDQLNLLGVFTLEQTAALKALAVLPCSRATELGLGPVHALDVIEAMQ